MPRKGLTPEYYPDGIDYAVTSPTPDYPAPPDKLFDVVQVVGSVYSGGTEDPYVVAFHLIATATQHGGPPTSTFTFPREDGQTVSVTVELPPPFNAQ